MLVADCRGYLPQAIQVIPFPDGVRIITTADEKRIFDLCCMAHGENGFGQMDETMVKDVIHKAALRQGCIIAAIDGPENIEAMLGLWPAKLWYCTDDPQNWYWRDMFFYVHPLHRRSRHAATLFRFARWHEEKMQQPVILELMPRDGFEEKDKLFGRFGHRIGSAFAMGDLTVKAVQGSNARH